MSTTFASGSARTQKNTCAKCKRTVYVVVIDGVRVETDPELLTVIPLDSSPAKKINARRSHGELCMKYQLENERAAMKRGASKPSKPMRWIDLATGAPVILKKPLPGRREPGQ